MKKFFIYSIMFFALIGSFFVTGYSNTSIDFVYAYTDNITKYRESLAYINKYYDDCVSNRLIIKSKHLIQDENAVCMASGFAGLNVIQYENENDTLLALKYYSSLPYVEYVEQDVEITIDDIVSYDDNFTMEGLKYLSWGSDLLGIETYQNYLLTKYSSNLPELYVAVLDTGIDTDHEFLKDRIAYDLGISYYDSELFLSSSSSYKFEDDNSHGTHVAGTIVDLTMDNVKIIPIKVLNSAGSGSMSNVISGMEYVLSLKNSGTNICAFNMSLSGYGTSSQQELIVNKCYEANIMPVVAAGNDNYYAENCTPANCEKALTISALSQNEYYENFPYIASYSNYGNVVDLCLPGTKILSCVPNETRYSQIYTSSTGGKYAVISGTSMATPHATALVALYATFYDDLYDVSVVEEQIKSNTYDFGALGKDELYGYGVPSMALAINKYELKNEPTLNYGTINSNYNFDNKIDIEILNNNEVVENHSYKIYYTLDGSYPTLINFNEYDSSISINHSSLLRFVIYMFDEDGNICGDSDLYEINYFKGKETLNSSGTGFEITSDGIINKYTSGLKNIVLPEYINGIKVKGLAKNLFYGLNIESFICNYDISIAYYPFVSCDALKQITLNSSQAEYIAKNCFALKELNLPNITEIKEGYAGASPILGYFGSQTFEGCFNLEIFNAPKIIEIKDNVFSGFEKLKVVSIDWTNLYNIGENAFECCLLLNISIEANNLRYMGKCSFYSSGINSFTAEKLKAINERAFYDCNNLKSLYLASINTIYSYAIYNSNNLKTIFLGDNDLKLYTDSITSTYLADFTIYCYNPEYVSNFTTQKCIDIAPTIKSIEDDIVKVYISGYYLTVYVYRSNDEKLSQDDILVNTAEFNGLNIDTEFYFDYLDNGNKNYIVVVLDMFDNQNILCLNKTGTVDVFDIIVESNIGECGLTSSSFSYYANENVELKLNEIIGYTLNSILIDGVEAINNFVENTYKFTMPNRDINITLDYSPIYYKVVLNIVGDGNGSVVDEEDNEITLAKYEQTILLKYSSNDSYISSIYYVTNSNIIIKLDVNNNSTSFVMPNSNIEIYIVFKKNNLSNFNVWYSDYSKTYSLSSYSGTDAIVQIPQYITKNGTQYRLSSFNKYCFYNNSYLEKIEVQFADNNRNIVIGENAFGNCTNLKFVNVGNITYLDNYAFSKCVNLKMINLENCEYIGKECFYECHSLANIDLSKCSQMLKYAFSGCFELENVILTNTLKTIPENAFSNCYNLKSINLSNVEKIGSSAFWNCKNITSIDLSMCNELLQSDTLDNWAYNFYSCTSLKSVVNPRKLKTIPYSAFANCYSLEDFDLSQCETLCKNAFSNCNKLVNIDLSNIKEAGGYPFTEIRRLVFGSNSYLITASELELTFYLSYIYIDKDYIGNIGEFIANNFTYSYEIQNYKVYTKRSAYYVTFKLEDGTIISQDIYTWGDFIKFPIQYQDIVYTYNFINWIDESTSQIVEANDSTPVHSSVVYIANDYNKEYNKFVVKFYYGYDYDNSGIIGDDGDIFYLATYHYGDIIQPLSLLPLKSSNLQFDYTFQNWINNNTFYDNNNLPNIYSDLIFIANYQSSLRKYTISWYDGDNVLIYKEDIEYGSMPEYKLLKYGEPKKSSGDINNIYYTFNNWSPVIKSVNGECSYFAQFLTNYYEYIVQFYYGYDYDEDGQENSTGDIFTSKTYHFYDLIDDEYCEHFYRKLGKIYTFERWSIDLTNKTPEQLYTFFDENRILRIYALYQEEKNIYTIRWFDGQNELIYADYLPYGRLPKYNLNQYGKPLKNQTNYNYYEFSGWDKEIVEVTSNTDYYAVFDAYTKLYNITWLNGNNEVIYTDKLPYASNVRYDYQTYGNPIKDSTNYYKYKFHQWSNLQDNEIVLGDKAFISEYKAYNMVNSLNDNYQIVDISALSSINSVVIDVNDIKNGCKLEVKFENVSILLNEINTASLKTGNDLTIKTSMNYNQGKKGRITRFWTFTIDMLLDESKLKTFSNEILINLNCLLDDESKLYLNNKELDYIQISTDTISFTTNIIGEFVYGQRNSSVFIISLIIIGVLLTSAGVVTSIVILRKRKNKIAKFLWHSN